MKKTILISLGILVLIVVVGAWYYLFMFGTPKSVEQVFSNFGIGSNKEVVFDPVPPPSNEVVPPPAQNGNAKELRQLTTKPVAGMVFTDTNTVRYAEQGTGFIFDLDLKTGKEVQVSNTTFVKAREAEFSQTGSNVVITHIENGVPRVTVGSIDPKDGGLKEPTDLINRADEIGFDTSSNTVNYLVEMGADTNAYAFDLTKRKSTLLFSVPFQGVRAIWERSTYVYTRPASTLLGYVYKIVKGTPAYVTNGGFGLTATYWNGGVITTVRNDQGELRSSAIVNSQPVEVALAIFPEKCTVPAPKIGDLVCGGALELESNHTYPDDWYKGVVSQNDLLWSIDIEDETATLLAEPSIETGRPLDVTKMQSNTMGDEFLFVNKNDNTLWLFSPEL